MKKPYHWVTKRDLATVETEHLATEKTIRVVTPFINKVTIMLVTLTLVLTTKELAPFYPIKGKTFHIFTLQEILEVIIIRVLLECLGELDRSWTRRLSDAWTLSTKSIHQRPQNGYNLRELRQVVSNLSISQLPRLSTRIRQRG